MTDNTEPGSWLELELAFHRGSAQTHPSVAGRKHHDEAADALEAAIADKRRLDWLADLNNTIGQVLLPTACVEANLHDMRAAIDAAMRMGDSE